MPPTDLLGGLDKIERKAAAGEYKSQYEFDTELKALSVSAYQGHFSVTLCSMSLFIFENSVPLVSISSNGTSLPEVYTKGKFYTGILQFGYSLTLKKRMLFSLGPLTKVLYHP